MPKVSQKSVARYGTPVRTAVRHDVAHALLAESKRLKRSVGHVAAQVLEVWFEQDYKWYLEQQAKKITGG